MLVVQGFPPVYVYRPHPLDNVSSSSSSSSSSPSPTRHWHRHIYPSFKSQTKARFLQLMQSSSSSSSIQRPFPVSFSSKQTSDLSGDGDDDEGFDFEGFDLRGIEIEIEKVGNNCRRIRSSKVPIDATLQTIWNILTDYERLADFIPGLAHCQLLHKSPNFARLFQIGQQNLAFGLKFKAKGVVDCYEKDLESLPSGQKRDIEFKMIEGDFQLFEGKWSIQEYTEGRLEENGSLASQGFCTTLSYVVDVKPKMWLPVRLVEGRLCREIQMNLSCIREEAQKASRKILPLQ